MRLSEHVRVLLYLSVCASKWSLIVNILLYMCHAQVYCRFLVQIFQCGMLPNYMQSACFSLHIVHMHASVSMQFTCFSLHAIHMLQSPCSLHASVSMQFACFSLHIVQYFSLQAAYLRAKCDHRLDLRSHISVVMLQA